jgi:hypothetical protein
VDEVAKEVVGKKLLGGAELAAWSAGWGNDRRKLPPVRCSWRKTMAGKSCGPASPASVAGRVSVQEGHGAGGALLLAWLDRLGRLVNNS